MRQISSAWTLWHKRGFPIVWFGFMGLITLVLILSIILGRNSALLLLVPIGFAAVGYISMRWSRVFSFMDEVWLENDQVIVRDGDQEDRFSVANILTVRASWLTYPERIVLTLAKPCRFGHEIVLSPPIRLFNITPHPLAEELSALAEQARRMRQASRDATA
jgi:hypothetical protein